MKWSRSEFLNLIELRSQCWCFVELDAMSGFNVRYNDCVMFYTPLDGSVTLSGITSGSVKLAQGDVLLVLSGEAHTLRAGGRGSADVLDFLGSDEYVDIPPTFAVGKGTCSVRLLCSRLKVRWPSGKRPQGLPATLNLKSGDSPVDFRVIEKVCGSAGATALLTKTAHMLFVAAFREHPDCRFLHQITNSDDPILRAKQYIELHPFTHWTIAALAKKVGMGRSNFAARFVEKMGLTPMEFITAERMQHAVRLLEQTDMKIASISQHVGYRSEAAFSRRFTEYYGVSPGKMRRGSAGLSKPATLDKSPGENLIDADRQH